MKYFSVLLASLLFAAAISVVHAQKNLAIVGSSTSACTGSTVADSCYVGRLRNYYNKLAPADTVINNNFAVAGSTVYNGMPSSYISPYTDLSLKPDTLHNITAALKTRPNAVLINYPSNGYDFLSISEILFCLRTIRNTANQAGVPCYITTTQPRTSGNFNTVAAKAKLAILKDSILAQFGNYAIDFYTGLVNPSDSSIRYDAGDGTHMNNTGHDSLFRRVVRKNVFVTAPPVPACASNRTPVNGATLSTSNSATLVWNAAANAASYDVYLWTGSSPSATPTANVGTATFTITSLLAATLYNWYVVPKNASGSATGCNATNKSTFTTAVANNAAGTGLKGVYYDGIMLTGAPLLTRIDPVIDFAFTYATVLSPAPGIVPTDLYSVRWTGKVKAKFSETYTFYTLADDGARLWVNGVQLVNNWENQGATEKSGSIALAAGQQYDIVLEYYENKGESFTKLSWSGASTPKAVIPQSQLYPPSAATAPACVTNTAPSNGSLVGTSNTAVLTWAAGSNIVSYDVYLWTGTAAPAAAKANVTTNSYNATGLAASTVYNWYVVPKNANGSASGCATNKTTFTTAAATATAGTGLQGVYYSGTGLSGVPLLTRVDPVINFALTYATSLSPAPGIVPTDGYSVRWTGQVKAVYSETYTFYTLSDDGIRLWVNGVLLVDDWVNQGATEKNASITMVAGQRYDIVIEYYEGTGEAFTKLSWSGASTPKEVVPQTQLYPPDAAARMAAAETMATKTLQATSTSSGFTASLLPNPVKSGQAAMLQVSANKTATAIIDIISSNGFIINTKKINLVAGMNAISLNAFSLQQGFYAVRISGVEKPVTLKLVID